MTVAVHTFLEQESDFLRKICQHQPRLIQNKLTVRKLKVDLDDLCKQHWLEVPKFNSALAEVGKVPLDRKHRIGSFLCSNKNVIESW